MARRRRPVVGVMILSHGRPDNQRTLRALTKAGWTGPVRILLDTDDVTAAYVVNGSRGDLYFTATRVSIEQPDTQSSSGGMTDTYLDGGTYVKSFYTVMMAPSCVKVTRMGETSKRFHHEVTWDHAVPKILSDRHRKAQPRVGRSRAKA